MIKELINLLFLGDKNEVERPIANQKPVSEYTDKDIRELVKLKPVVDETVEPLPIPADVFKQIFTIQEQDYNHQQQLNELTLKMDGSQGKPKRKYKKKQPLNQINESAVLLHPKNTNNVKRQKSNNPGKPKQAAPVQHNARADS